MLFFTIMHIFDNSWFTLHEKMKFSTLNFFNKCDQILRKLCIWLHLLKKSLMENLIFCAVLLKSWFVSEFEEWRPIRASKGDVGVGLV